MVGGYIIPRFISFGQGWKWLAVTSQLPQILNAALEIVNSLRSGILSMLPDTIQATITLVTGLITELIQNLPMIVQAAIQLISGLLNSLYTSLPHRFLPVLST